jgi:hypothetical protein
MSKKNPTTGQQRESINEWITKKLNPHFPHRKETSWKRLTLPEEDREAEGKLRELLSYQYDKEAVLRLRQSIRPADTSPLQTSYPASKYINGHETVSSLGIHSSELVDFIWGGDLVPLKNGTGRPFREDEIPEGPAD